MKACACPFTRSSVVDVPPEAEPKAPRVVVSVTVALSTDAPSERVTRTVTVAGEVASTGSELGDTVTTTEAVGAGGAGGTGALGGGVGAEGESVEQPPSQTAKAPVRRIAEMDRIRRMEDSPTSYCLN
jgi:hypothetical protein